MTTPTQTSGHALTDLFKGQAILLEIEATRHSPAQREAIKKSISEEPPQKLRYNCLVADAMNRALMGGENGTHVDDYQTLKIGEHTYRLNPRARSQFGMDAHGVPYLTTSLVNVETDVRYAFTWRGDNVPEALKTLAVKHDQGKNTKAHAEILELDNAEIHIIGDKYPGQAERAERDRARRRNHDPKAALRAPRRTHRRICEADLKAVTAA